MAEFRLYAVRASDIDEANELFQRTTGMELELHRADFRGFYFGSDVYAPYKIVICDNVDYDDEEFIDDGLAEPQFPQHKILLYLNQADLMQKETDLVDAHPEIFTKLRVKIA